MKKQGKRGGRTPRRSTQTRENTPDASGNALHELERMFGEKSATKEYVETLHATSPQRIITSSNSCKALQRTAGRLRDWK